MQEKVISYNVHINTEKMFDESGIGVLMTLEQVEILRYRK